MIWGQLKTAATRFIHRKDIDWDTLAQFACDDISQKLVVMENEGSAFLELGAYDIGAALFKFDLPEDYAKMRVVRQGRYTLDPGSLKAIADARGYPLYAVSGRKLCLKGGSPVEIGYSTRTLAPVDDDDENEVMRFYSPVMLYALLKQGALVAKDFDAKDQYEAQFEQAIDAANATYLDAAFGAGMAPVTPGGVV